MLQHARNRARLNGREFNGQGYIKDNVLVVSAWSNRIKNDAEYQDILKVGNFYKKLHQQKIKNIVKEKLTKVTAEKDKKNNA